MPKLVTWMNNQRVGELTKLANGWFMLVRIMYIMLNCL